MKQTPSSKAGVLFGLRLDGKIEAQLLLTPDFTDAVYQAQMGVFRSVNAKWRKDRWVFHADRLFDVVYSAKAAGFEWGMTTAVQAIYKTQRKERKTAEHNPVPPPVGFSVKEHQKEGIAWLRSRWKRGKGALLADDMGLGKTMQTYMSLDVGAAAVVVCPAVAKGVWAREARLWRPDLTASVVKTAREFRWPTRSEVMIVSYNMLPAPVKLKKGLAFPKKFGLPDRPVFVVADECQLLKTWATQRAKRFRVLSAQAQIVGGKTTLLSGTPLLNKPVELWTVLQAAGIAREAFDNYKTFKACFKAHKTPTGKTVYGSADESVPHRLSRVMLRRKKDEVLDLPSKIYDPIEVEVKFTRKQAREFDELLQVLNIQKRAVDLQEILERARGDKLAFHALRRAQQSLALSKMPSALQLAIECEEAKQPVVVFSVFQDVVEPFSKRKGWAVITGKTSSARRTTIEEKFQRGELKGLAATIQAAGTALTLTRANRVVFNDLDWVPANNKQAEDRVYRIGQTKSVQVTTLTADHPLDRRIHELIEKKTFLINNTVELAARVRTVHDGGEQASEKTTVQTTEETDAETDGLRESGTRPPK